MWGSSDNNGGGNNPNNPGDGSSTGPTSPTGSTGSTGPTTPAGGGSDGSVSGGATIPTSGASTTSFADSNFTGSTNYDQSVPNMFNGIDADVLLTGVSRVRGTGLPQFNEALLSQPQLNITGDQLARMDASTINALVNSANPAHRTALIKASDQLINNPALLAQFKARNPRAVGQINTLRVGGIDPTHVGPRRAL